ncbi:MAG: biotin--[acetyl-CoA-carboxylase] ligase [Holophagaceae bacterium]
MSLPLIRLAEVDSTQSFLRRHPGLGFCAVVADTQTEGRGRQGNAWISAAGTGLWLSAAIPVPDIPPGLVLQRAMLKVANALGPFGLACGLKWPNDLVGRRDARLVKLGGIIGERSSGRLILGLGVNLTAAPELPGRAFPAACLADLDPVRVPSAEELALGILEEWQGWHREDEPRFLWPMAGDPIAWEAGQGACLGWEPDGRLKVATADGIQRLSAGDLRQVRPAG